MTTRKEADNYILVESRKIRYVNRGSGPPVILIHSLGGSLEWWDLTIPALAQHFSVYAFDFPGFGLSDRLGKNASADFPAQFMVKFMETLNIKQASLVGHSMGGYIAARTALEVPTKVVKLVLVASAGLGPVNHPILRFLSLPLIGEIAATPTLLGTRAFLRSLVHDKKFASQDRIETAFRHFRRPGAKQDFLRTLRAGLTLARKGNLLSPEDIRRITTPTMLIWGAEDPVFPPSQAEYANSLLPHSELHILDGYGHIPQIECATRFNELVSQFLLSPT